MFFSLHRGSLNKKLLFLFGKERGDYFEKMGSQAQPAQQKNMHKILTEHFKAHGVSQYDVIFVMEYLLRRSLSYKNEEGKQESVHPSDVILESQYLPKHLKVRIDNLDHISRYLLTKMYDYAYQSSSVMKNNFSLLEAAAIESEEALKACAPTY